MKNVVISEKIRKYREENSISLVRLSEILNVTPQAVYKWEHNICFPALTMLPTIADLLGCSVCDFFEDI